MRKSHQRISRLADIVRSHRFILLIILVLFIAILFAPICYTFLSTRGNRYDLSRVSITKVPYHRVAIVFGAGIQKNGTPTPYLRYRVETAAKLFKAHRIEKILMSGDNSAANHNEPIAMKNYALKLGVPAKAITLDYAGFNTYDSCSRAHIIFGLNDATLISQGYHLPRAMTTCQDLGIRNIGVIADHPTRDYTVNYLDRELLSTDKMVFQLIFKPNPTALGKPQIITMR